MENNAPALHDAQFIECGECGGCQAKKRIAELVAEVDEVFKSRLDAVKRSWEKWPHRDEHAARDLKRQLRGLMEERSRWIDYLTRPLAPLMGCYRLTILLPKSA